ncbi:MAG: tRNA glutamyl-Q(34) synthetase GluQRS, partial [Steroidobacteraceae bacterium]
MRPSASHTTRFAPSPTGWLHLGHALAAITAYEAAGAGTFLLRIEDLDRGRCRPEFEAGVLEDLAWLGLSWEQPVLRQSERSQAYRDALSTLDRAGLLYPCFCSRKEILQELERAGEAPHRSGEVIYPGSCRSLSVREREQRKARGEPFALRLDSSKASAMTGALGFTELGRGPKREAGAIAVDPTLLGDIVLARPGLPAAYHLAVVVDDAFQGVSRVTRASDLFPSTHVQRLLQALLGVAAPVYAHHRLILDDSGKKLSKRDHSTTLRSLRGHGID